MQYQPTNDSPEQFQSAFREKREPLREPAISACDTITRKTCEMCDCASDGIRKNPLASVFGAAVFGAAVCYLILERQREASFGEKYFSGPLADAGDTVSTSLRSAFDHLKFW